MIDGARRVVREGESAKPDELWRGNAYHLLPPISKHETVYFRLSKAATLQAELVAAVMAQALGLQTPQPYILHIDPGGLPGSRFCLADRATLCVATQNIGGNTFAQLLRTDSAYATSLIRKWTQLLPTVAFDEWVANPDRNLGNIIYVASALWLIDHAEAFCGSARGLFSFTDLQADLFANKLADLLHPATKSQKVAHLSHVRTWLAETGRGLDIERLVALTNVTAWQKSDGAGELVNFIKQRFLLTHHLLCQRLGLPQLSLHQEQ